jgi:hypothetical protein
MRPIDARKSPCPTNGKIRKKDHRAGRLERARSSVNHDPPVVDLQCQPRTEVSSVPLTISQRAPLKIVEASPIHHPRSTSHRPAASFVSTSRPTDLTAVAQSHQELLSGQHRRSLRRPRVGAVHLEMLRRGRDGIFQCHSTQVDPAPPWCSPSCCGLAPI